MQLALFADTLIASFLPTGALSALYYADRINQLPIGVVGIAVGTVLLPEMSRRLAAGDVRGAALAQARGIQLALLMAVPCVAGAIAIPDLIMRALFARGAFTAADAAAAGATLAAYAIGLLPFVMMRSFTAPFYARGDRLKAVKQVACNVHEPNRIPQSLKSGEICWICFSTAPCEVPRRHGIGQGAEFALPLSGKRGGGMTAHDHQ